MKKIVNVFGTKLDLERIVDFDWIDEPGRTFVMEVIYQRRKDRKPEKIKFYGNTSVEFLAQYQIATDWKPGQKLGEGFIKGV